MNSAVRLRETKLTSEQPPHRGWRSLKVLEIVTVFKNVSLNSLFIRRREKWVRKSKIKIPLPGRGLHVTPPLPRRLSGLSVSWKYGIIIRSKVTHTRDSLLARLWTSSLEMSHQLFEPEDRGRGSAFFRVLILQKGWLAQSHVSDISRLTRLLNNCWSSFPHRTMILRGRFAGFTPGNVFDEPVTSS